MIARVRTARAWKNLYAMERAELGAAGLRALVERAPSVALPRRGALVFPHTHLRSSGHLTAAVARAVVRSGRDEVLALGVLHGAREEDAALVASARSGDAAAVERLRRVHAPPGHASEEFSLDGFAALLAAAAELEGRAAPRLVARYPFLASAEPGTLPGIDELAASRDRGAALVATADPIHHGAGYGTPRSAWRPRDEAHDFARATIERSLGLLARLDFLAFAKDAVEARSDFRDAGPVLAWLLRGEGELRGTLIDLDLADYAATLGAEDPTWVAGALISFHAT
jgi:hypothetical protein